MMRAWSLTCIFDRILSQRATSDLAANKGAELRLRPGSSPAIAFAFLNYLRSRGERGSPVREPGREFMSSSERVPGRGRREFEIADIRTQPYPYPRADRDHDDVVHCQRRHSQAAD
jgi:hypothetical protein